VIVLGNATVRVLTRRMFDDVAFARHVVDAATTEERTR